jgi:heat shock protein HslJ
MLDTVAIPADTGRRAPHMQITEAAGKTTYSSTVGCNGVGGGATIDGDRITFGPGMSTKMWCGDLLNDWETRLSAALSGTRRYSITGDTLELRDDNSVRVAKFVKGIPPS